MIPITRLSVGAAEAEAAAETIRSGWLAQGKRTIEFENLVAKYVGAEHAIAVSSCTTAFILQAMNDNNHGRLISSICHPAASASPARVQPTCQRAGSPAGQSPSACGLVMNCGWAGPSDCCPNTSYSMAHRISSCTTATIRSRT